MNCIYRVSLNNTRNDVWVVRVKPQNTSTTSVTMITADPYAVPNIGTGAAGPYRWWWLYQLLQDNLNFQQVTHTLV
jgi:hypothetical protein